MFDQQLHLAQLRLLYTLLMRERAAAALAV
jgi:hypothetical protein